MVCLIRQYFIWTGNPQYSAPITGADNGGRRVYHDPGDKEVKEGRGGTDPRAQVEEAEHKSIMD